MRCCEKGRSMIEMLGVLSIVGMLSIGALNGYAKATAKMKRDKLVYQVSEMVINIRSLYFQQADFEGISAKILVRNGAIPHEMFDPKDRDNENVNLYHAFGGNVLIFPSKKDNTDRKMAFELYLKGLNHDACVAMATTDWGQDPASGFIAMYIGLNDINAPQMQDIYSTADNDEAQGIFTSGQHELAVPLPIPTAYSVCACPANECVIGLKYL